MGKPGFSVIANERRIEMGYWEAHAIFTAKRATPSPFDVAKGHRQPRREGG